MTDLPPTGDRPEPEGAPTGPTPAGAPVPWHHPSRRNPSGPPPRLHPRAAHPRRLHARSRRAPASSASHRGGHTTSLRGRQLRRQRQPPAQPAWQAPPAPPPNTPEVPGAPGRYFAATVTRVAALLIDTILLGILAGIVTGILSALMPGQFALDGDPTFRSFGPGFAIVGLGGLVVSYLYFFLSWRSAGKATPGQRVFRMQVGNAFDGAALTPRQVTIRWLTLFGIGILAALPVLAGLGGLLSFIWDIVLLVTTATSATKQGIHDRWAGSAVVATGPQNTTLAWGCLIAWVVGVLLIVALAFALIVAIAAALYGIN